MVAVDHSFGAMQLCAVLLHHSVICGFYKLHRHVGIYVVAKDFLGICVLEGLQVNGRTRRAIVQISDVGEDDFSGADIKILLNCVQRSRILVVAGWEHHIDLPRPFGKAFVFHHLPDEISVLLVLRNPLHCCWAVLVFQRGIVRGAGNAQ